MYPSARCCLAIHNLAHQGSFEAHAFHEVGLSGDWYGMLEWESPDDTHRRKTINILKVCRVWGGEGRGGHKGHALQVG